MRAGPMRHRVTIQTRSIATRDSEGGVTESWSTYAKRWASIRPLRGEELFAAQQKYGKVSHEFSIRNTTGVTPEMRISYDSRTFNIVSAINVNERDRETLILATERIG